MRRVRTGWSGRPHSCRAIGRLAGGLGCAGCLAGWLLSAPWRLLPTWSGNCRVLHMVTEGAQVAWDIRSQQTCVFHVSASVMFAVGPPKQVTRAISDSTWEWIMQVCGHREVIMAGVLQTAHYSDIWWTSGIRKKMIHSDVTRPLYG